MLLSLLVSAAVTAHPVINALGSDPPLFAAFKKFCVETGTRPDAVKKAVEAAGGHLFKGPVSSDGWPFVKGLMTWDVTVDGHAFRISSDSQEIPAHFGNNPAWNSENCDLHEFDADDASVAAIGNWAGVPPDPDSSTGTSRLPDGRRMPGFLLQNYSYTIAGTSHAPVKDQASLREAEREGRYWMLVVTSDNQYVSVQFSHELGAGAGPTTH
jgi:hypothetical protein